MEDLSCIQSHLNQLMEVDDSNYGPLVGESASEIILIMPLRPKD